jgi:hypothetical protein
MPCGKGGSFEISLWRGGENWHILGFSLFHESPSLLWQGPITNIIRNVLYFIGYFFIISKVVLQELFMAAEEREEYS